MPVEIEQVGKRQNSDVHKVAVSYLQACINLQVPADEFALLEFAVASAEKGRAPVFRPSWPQGSTLQGWLMILSC